MFLGGVLLFASHIVRIAVGRARAGHAATRGFRHDPRIPIITTGIADDRSSVA